MRKRQINGEAKSWRKREKSKYESKDEHIRNLRNIEIEKMLETCPRELNEYIELKIFKKGEMENMIKEEVVISKIGKVDLDQDEIAILKLPPKFAVINKLDMPQRIRRIQRIKDFQKRRNGEYDKRGSGYQ